MLMLAGWRQWPKRDRKRVGDAIPVCSIGRTSARPICTLVLGFAICRRAEGDFMFRSVGLVVFTISFHGRRSFIFTVGTHNESAEIS